MHSSPLSPASCHTLPVTTRLPVGLSREQGCTPWGSLHDVCDVLLTYSFMWTYFHVSWVYV